MTSNLKILIISYVYNHHVTLASFAKAVVNAGHDLLVIDDDSDNKSCLQTIAELQCRVLRLTQHVGKGAAVLLGAKQAANLGYDSIVSIDCDGSHNPVDIILLVEKAKSSKAPTLIIGTPQKIHSASSNRDYFHTSSANLWVRLACGAEVPDAESGFRLYPLKELLAQKLTRSHHGFEIETLVKLVWSGIDVVSVTTASAAFFTEIKVSRIAQFKERANKVLLYGQLLFRRLLPWPYKKLIEKEPYPEKILKTISRNPLKVLGEICRQHTSPLWLAMAVWLGIFMGALPLLAIHTIAIIYVAHRLHMNKVAAVAASQFCMPPVVPVLCIQMGYYLRNGELLVDFSWQPWLLGIHERLWEWLLGSLLIGPLLGLIGAGLMYFTANHLQKSPLKSM